MGEGYSKIGEELGYGEEGGWIIGGGKKVAGFCCVW